MIRSAPSLVWRSLDCLALSDDAETHEAAQTIAEVLWDDLEFEREFLMVARDTYDSIPAARSVTNLPLQPSGVSLVPMAWSVVLLSERVTTRFA